MSTFIVLGSNRPEIAFVVRTRTGVVVVVFCLNVIMFFVFFSISSCCSSENVAVIHDIHIAACSVAVVLLVIQSELRRFCCLVGNGASRPLSREFRGDPSIVKKMSTVFFLISLLVEANFFPYRFPLLQDSLSSRQNLIKLLFLSFD